MSDTHKSFRDIKKINIIIFLTVLPDSGIIEDFNMIDEAED